MTLTEIGIIIEDTLDVRKVDSRYVVTFRSVNIKEGGCTSSPYGQGQTMTAAKKDYAEELAGQIIVLNPYRYDKLEFQLPPKITIR